METPVLNRFEDLKRLQLPERYPQFLKLANEFNIRDMVDANQIQTAWLGDYSLKERITHLLAAFVIFLALVEYPQYKIPNGKFLGIQRYKTINRYTTALHILDCADSDYNEAIRLYREYLRLK